MAILPQFSAPANLPQASEDDAEAWSERVTAMVGPFSAAFDQFYDPTEEDTPADAVIVPVLWSAFPARLRHLAEEERWHQADENRDEQDEYCEWGVEKDGDQITRVTFTSEVPQYFQHLAERDREHGTDRVLEFYREFVDPETRPEQIVLDGTYVLENELNQSTSGRPAHLVTGDNNLFAAIALVAQATILRERDGVPVTTQQALVQCAGNLGNFRRHSDPQIAGVVNAAAATGAEITLADPVGLYINSLQTAEMVAPDRADVSEFWHVERGEAGRVLRASFSVPEERGYTVSNVELAGQPIRFGAQLAERVEVKAVAVVKPGTHESARQPCTHPLVG